MSLIPKESPVKHQFTVQNVNDNGRSVFLDVDSNTMPEMESIQLFQNQQEKHKFVIGKMYCASIYSETWKDKVYYKINDTRQNGVSIIEKDGSASPTEARQQPLEGITTPTLKIVSEIPHSRSGAGSTRNEPWTKRDMAIPCSGLYKSCIEKGMSAADARAFCEHYIETVNKLHSEQG